MEGSAIQYKVHLNFLLLSSTKSQVHLVIVMLFATHFGAQITWCPLHMRGKTELAQSWLAPGNE